ncbi:MAG: NADH-quinone oxidoreductase subunit L, partial [Opitutales bacterium]|nr:NADH-quinone oxidoreductase subunit L [Opitutales bacterium]
MYLLIFLACLVSFVIASLFGRFLGYLGVCFFTTLSVLISNLLSFILLYEVVLNESICYLPLFKWLQLDLIDISFTLRFDTLASFMLVVITSISLCAHLYSISYMNGDPHQARFMSYLSLFTWFMIILVTSSNLLQLFLGWEGVGVCSYLLINFWYTRIQANKSAIKAMLTNKISDICLTIGMLFIFLEFKTLNFDLIFCLLSTNMYVTLNTICLLLLIGAVGKSAQIMLHVWLPDAMEGPTPVSSLIHAATMVTAGIFLIIRCSYLFEYCGNISLLIIFLGALTAFFSSTTGFFQNDIKKVIAYSTCSQLGYMFFICGFSYYNVSFYHLFNHAFFKALLFLTAGCLIHSIGGEQDIRTMGGLLKVFPFAYICLFIGSISLLGFPFMTGFYSKDLIIESSYNSFLYQNHISFGYIHSLFWLLVVSILFTALYSLRVLLIVFFKEFMGKLHIIKNVHHTDLYTIIPLTYLSILSIFIGYLTRDLIVGIGTPVWDISIYNITYYIDFEFYSVPYKVIPLILSIYSMIVIYIVYYSCNSIFEYIKLNITYNNYYVFFNQKLLFDK